MSQAQARALTGAVTLLALLVWWPIGSYWQSDDFLALTYAREPRRALADLAGNQYGTTALVWFYRPLITLSFALDAQLGGAGPFVAHVSNTIAHALSTLLLTLIGRRLLGNRAGLCLGLLWTVWPTHAGSILWAVGRVDSHTTVWILLAVFCTLRWLDHGRGLALALVAFVLALLSKELAFVVPGLALLLGCVTAPPGLRVRRAAQAAWPFLAVFAVYLVWRVYVLGRLVGGYQDARLPLGPSLQGLGVWCARLANPLLDPVDPASSLGWLGFVLWPIAVAGVLLRRRWRALVLLSVAFALCALPTAPFWAETAEIKNVRYFYLPAASLLGVLALGGRCVTLLALVCVAWPLAAVRLHYRAAHAQAAALHAALRRADAELPRGPLFVQGLPRENPTRDVLMFHLFVDRLLMPPFGSGRAVFALRPLVDRPGVLTVPSELSAGLAGYHAFMFTSDGTAVRIVEPELPPLAVDSERVLHLSSRTMWDLHAGRATKLLRFPGNRAPCYRLTLFTAGGYVSTVLPNEAADGTDGFVSVKNLIARGRYATEGDDAAVALALSVPAAFDLSTDFPLMAEAGELTGTDPHTFAPRARAPHALILRLDRDYCEWIAGRVPE